MRKQIHKTLKKEFRQQLLNERRSFGYTQSEMSETLCMDPRSYINLEQGKSGCSATTLALYLMYVCPDVNGFIKKLRDEFELETEK